MASLADATRLGDNYALVIIDMQPYYVTRGKNEKRSGNLEKVDQVLSSQIELIRLARKQEIPIIFIEYQGSGSTDQRLKEAVKGYRPVKFFLKDRDGMFSSSDSSLVAKLSRYLRSKRVGNLIIAGANGGACVKDSIYGALYNNYNVLAYSKGIADFNYQDFIYPYKGQYKFDLPCKSCVFRETDAPGVIALEFAIGWIKPGIVINNINDSERSELKSVPDKREKTTKETGATAQ